MWSWQSNGRAEAIVAGRRESPRRTGPSAFGVPTLGVRFAASSGGMLTRALKSAASVG
jgi:hypothetical protein